MKTDTGSASRYIRLTLTLGSIALLTLALAGDSSVRVFADKPGEYDLTWADPADEVDLPAVYRAVNLAQGMRLYFGETGVALAPEQSHADGWSLGIEVAGYGYADEVTPVGGASLEADANRIDYAFSEALSGWYLNGARGLQQGFTLAAPTHRLAPDSRPHVDFVLSGDPVAFLSDDGATLWLAQSHHEAFLRYSLLQATTRTGSQLQARFEVVSDGRGAPVGLRLLVSEGVSAAAYPISLELLAESGAGVSTASAVYPTSYELLAGSGASADLGAGSLSGPLQALEGPGSSGGQATPLAATAAQSFVTEIEPNGTPLTATPLGGLNVVAFGNVFPGIEDDYYSLTVNGGDRVYVATMGGFSAASGSGDTAINVYDSDGTTSLEFDDDDGVFGTFSSSIAGVTVPGSGSKTIFIKVRGFGGGAVGPGSTQVRPYHLHVRVQQSGAPISDAPTPEAAEPNDGFAFFLPPNGWVSGTFGATGDLDFYAITLAAGESVYISADWNPERDAITWDGRIFFGPFGDGAGSLIALNDASVTSPNSDAAFWTVKNAGVYQILVTGVTFAPSLTYNLSVSVHPAVPATSTCTTYPYTGPAVTLGPGPSTTPASASITVPGPSPRRIADLDVSIELTHSLMADLDVHLRSPALNDNGLFTDIGAPATAGQISMDTILDDEAASSIQSSSGSGFPLHLRGNVLQPEQAYRLHWFDGEDAVGTWTLDLRDDANAASGGTLTAWSLTICEPAPPPSCAGTPVTLLSTDFEAGAAGFTTAGTANEWELGLPTFAPITTCNSGTSCWKTDLDNTYDVSSNQDLLSPSVSLLGLTGPITATWAHRYQMQSSQTGTINPDRFIVEVREVPSANPKSLFEFFDFTMTNSVGGTTAVTLNESGGWGVFSKDISSYANKTVQLRFNLTSDTSTNLAGLAIDDVTITACCTAASCNDNNPCTDDVCTAAGCTHMNNSGSCEDGNPCTGPDVCAGGACVPGPNPCDDGDACTEDVCDGGGGCSYPAVDCNDANPCTNDGCDSVTGCFNVPNSDPCSDGNPCTINDACAGGACVPGPLPAPVSFCNAGSISIPASGSATPYPSSISVSGQPLTLCKTTVDLKALVHTFPDDVDMLLVAPGTVTNAIIMSDVGGGTDVPNPPATVLNLTLDDAAATSLPDGGPLASGTFKPTNIGAGDVFAAPAPAAGGGSALSAFNGSNPNGSWSLYVTDQFSPDGGALSGGWCVNLRMVCTSDAECDDGNPCTDDACDRGACVHDNNTDPCDDGNPCTDPDVCGGGECIPGTNPCDDGDACTEDVCDGGGGCSYPPVDCNDGNPCTNDGCDSVTGCFNVPNTDPCDDGNACTINDQCGGGTCLPGPGPALVQFCNTGSISIPDSGTATPYPSNLSVSGQPPVLCKATVNLNGVTHTFPVDIDVLLVAPGTVSNSIIMSDVGGTAAVSGINLTLDDAAPSPLSTSTLVSGTFKPTNFGTGDVFAAPAPASSPADNATLAVLNGSNPNGTWKLFVVDDVGGDLGSISGGWCVNVGSVCTDDSMCDDGNPCTDDACDRGACVHDNNTDPCDDGNPCTDPDVCGGGECIPGTNPCDDGDACTEDVCDGGGGCSYPLVDCNDANPCTNDGCDSVTGCFNVPNSDPCSDGDPCTINDACAGGACVPGPLPAPVSFCNAGSISIPASGSATPYPSSISVSGQPLTLCKTTVDLKALVHTFPDDVDMLLVAPGTVTNAIIMSDVGGSTDVPNPPATVLNLTLDDAAATSLPDGGPLASGTFKPTNIGVGDVFAAPAPAAGGGSALSAFNGSNPNGSWSLYVTDQFTPDGGALSGGWCVNLRMVCTSDAECDDGNPCTDDACDRGACVHDNNTDPCDDGDSCSMDDTCAAGSCSGTPIDCDDGIDCTIDGCDEVCTHTPDDGACSNGLFCDGDEVCNPVSGCEPGTPPDCDDGIGCTIDSCDTGSDSCENAPDDGACDDGDPCTVDTCTAGGCDYEFICCDEPQPRSSGFYKRMCNPANPPQANPLSQADADCVNDTCTFADVESVEDMCEILTSVAGPCARAEREFMALAINICRGQICEGDPISSDCAGNNSTTAGEALAQGDALLCNASPSVSDCFTAACVSYDINSGRAINVDAMTADKIIGNHVRLTWQLPLHDPAKSIVLYRVWRSVDGGPWALVGEVPPNVPKTWVDTTAQGLARCDYQVTAVLE